MKIVLVNRYFFPDHSATSQLLSDLAFYLAEQGVDVRIVTSRQRYDEPNAHLKKKEVIGSVHVERVWTSHFGRQNLVGRAFDYLTFYASTGWRLIWLLRRGDVVVAKTDPPLISVVVAAVSKLRGARLVNWLQDVFPEVAVALGVKALGGRFGAWVRSLRDVSLRAAVMNVVLGEHMAERVRACGVSVDKVRVISNWADGGVITPIPAYANPLRAEWNLTGKFVVMYSGNMGRAHEFETILGAAELLQADARFVFLFVGGGNQRGPLGSEVARRGLANVEFRPYQPRERLGLSLTVGDAHLISLRPELEGLIFPSKFYGVLAAGRPVVFVGAPAGEIARQVSQADCGVAVEQGDARGLADALVRLADTPAVCERMGENGRRLFDDTLSQTAALAAWVAILDDQSAQFFIDGGAQLR